MPRVILIRDSGGATVDVQISERARLSRLSPQVTQPFSLLLHNDVVVYFVCLDDPNRLIVVVLVHFESEKGYPRIPTIP